MINKRTSTYQLLVYFAYGFYFLLGLTWFIMSFMNGGRFNPSAFFVVVIFGAQMYYRHLMTNLILGIITLLFSIYMFLYALNGALTSAHNGSLMLFDKLMVAMSALSIIFAGVLIFSYLKLSFKE